MWKNHVPALVSYGVHICDEWIARGYSDSTAPKIIEFSTKLWTQSQLEMPKWLGNEALHASHRGNLLRKDPEYYGRFGWTDNPLLDYVWPGEG